MTALTLTNATLVLPDRLMLGTLRVEGGVITDIAPGASAAPGAVDIDGDLLMPGLIELHTDNLERHIQPRPGVDWPHASAILSHDAELASTGITTVFDALRVGSLVSSGRGYGEYARGLADEILAARAAGALKISHFLHLRAEICSETLCAELEQFTAADPVRIVSLMDHTPGQRQFADLAQLRRYMRGKYGLTEDEFQAHVEVQTALGNRLRDRHEAAAVAAGRGFGAALASHDDTTEDHVRQSAAHGVALAEFPTTMEAARACHQQGIAVMMGAPNLIRGGSHSGNVAARDLAVAGYLDILSSDYVPSALLAGALMLGDLWGDMARGLATVTAAPASATGLHDRGQLRPGLRADLVRLRRFGASASLRGVWVAGARVA